MKTETTRHQQTVRKFNLFFLFSILAGLQILYSAPVSKELTIYSTEIDDSVFIRIQLPENYNKYSDQHYPVLYLLDGDFYFDYAVATSNLLSKGIQPFTPEFIIVGISSSNRFRDFTPSHATVNNDNSPVPSNYKISGHADQFSAFMANTLSPMIRKEYRNNGFSVIFGHSLAGLYVMDLLLHQKAYYNAWIIADPSLWWDKEKLFRESTDLLKQPFNARSVFMGYTHSTSIPPGLDTTLMYDCNLEMDKRLQKKTSEFNLKTQLYPNCSHGTVVIPTLYNGLCSLFEGYSIDPKQHEFNLQKLLNQYEITSERIHFHLIPQEAQLEILVRYFLRDIHTRSIAKEFLVFWIKNYPKSKGWIFFQQKFDMI